MIDEQNKIVREETRNRKDSDDQAKRGQMLALPTANIQTTQFEGVDVHDCISWLESTSVCMRLVYSTGCEQRSGCGHDATPLPLSGTGWLRIVGLVTKWKRDSVEN